MRFGAHVSTGGALPTAPGRARALGADCVQVFVGNPRGWRTTEVTAEAAEEFRKACAETGVEPFVHCMYLVNYGTADDALRARSIAALEHTMRVADELGVTGVVTHLGSHKGTGFETGLDRLCEALDAGLAASRHTMLLPENSAGSGDTIGSSVDELATIADRLGRPDRLGVCLDTAHLLAAGYEIRTRPGLDALFGEFDERIGLDRLTLVHLNDSKTDLGSRVDRHENIGDGHIGTAGFTEFVNHPAVAGVPGVLEVPGLAGKGPDAANLDRLRAMLR
ncbi:deoxyribonuclease IV [Actinocatenispora rupis]|uniref:Probable endonuclease 4 n=1 Tax=Actinocatenispora rupis TaxID=519421 RepID=A0A8J3JAB8_9ACTN|nr:deoxyribonuclease IV [Actinocatenispora rupis]GID14770.1 putative endonuclease 4 [Actinocatenispora rupis]